MTRMMSVQELKEAHPGQLKEIVFPTVFLRDYSKKKKLIA
jgi:hypothetical protein